MNSTIPFHYAREGVPLIMIPAMINGEGPFEFIVDSGNGLLAAALSPEIAARLNLELREEVVESKFPIGFSKQVSMGNIESLEVGDIRNGQMEVGVLPALTELSKMISAPIDGNFGYPFLSKYTLGLDFERRELTLSPNEADGPWTPFHIGQAKPLIVVDAAANGRPLRFVLDTGASYSCLSISAAERLKLELGAEFPVNGSATDRARKATLQSLEVCGMSQSDAGVAVAAFVDDLDEVVGEPVDGVLGHSFWSKYRLAIDYPRGRLHLAEE